MHSFRTHRRDIRAKHGRFFADADGSTTIVAPTLADVIAAAIDCEGSWAKGIAPAWESLDSPVSEVEGLAKALPAGAYIQDPLGEVDGATIHRLDCPFGGQETYWIEMEGAVRAFTQTQDANAWRNSVMLFGLAKADQDANRTMQDRGF